MNKNSFLAKVRYLAMAIMIIFAIYTVGIYIVSNYYEFNKNSKELKDNFFKKQKNLIKSEVSRVVDMVNYEESKKEEKARQIVKKQVLNSYEIVKAIYNSYKNTLDRDEIIKIVKTIFQNMKYNENEVKDTYLFIVNLDGDVILNADFNRFNGKNVLNLRDKTGNYFIQKMINLAKSDKQGFIKYKWRKPATEGEKFYDKVSYVKLFSPLNFFIGAGVYIDDIRNGIPENVNYYVQNHRFGKFNRGYVFIFKLLDIKGGKNFAIMYANANRPDLIGKYLSDDYKDAKGKEFRKEFLKGLRAKGECFVKYWYKKLGTDKTAPKLSYFKLTSNKKYIVAAGVYLDDINREIDIYYNKLKSETIRNVAMFISSVLIFLFLFIIILNIMSKKLKTDFNNFISLFKTASESDKTIDENKLEFDEFKRLALEINNILRDKIKILNRLTQSENKFRTIFEESSVPMLLLDKEKFLDCNEATVKMLMAENKSKILNHSPGEFSPEFQPNGENSEEKAKEIITDVYKTRNSKIFEWLHKRFNGELFWSLIHLNLIHYEGKEVIFVTWSDISHIKNLQQQLEKEKEKLAVTLYSIGDGVITTDRNGKIEFMNKVAERLTGWNSEEAKGYTLDKVFRIINETSRKVVENPVDKVIKEGVIVGLANHTLLISKDGKEYNIADSAAPIRDKDSNIVGVVLVFRDETEKAKLKTELFKREKFKSVSTLAAGIAHDFNNILTGIYGNLELVKIKISGASPATKNINLMSKSIERARKLTNQLLSFAKGGAPVTKTVDIRNIVKETVEFNVSGSNIAVHFDFQEDIWKTDVDKEQISEVISNLVINAKHAMEKGGNLYCKVENLEENDTHKEIGKFEKFVKITIRDQGKGIPQNIINKIFDPYFTTKKEGSGLGLSTVYSVIEKHNGFVKVESEENVGTKFYIYLPATFKEFEKNPGESSTDIFNPLSGIKILIMDDDEMIRNTAKDMFENLGAYVECCENCERTLELYRKNKFDIVILDLTIPGGLGGKECVKEILKIDNKAKIIVSSGYLSDPVIENHKLYGFKGKIIKPYKIREIVEEIKKVLK